MSLRNKEILVIGGTGFIGRNLIPELVKLDIKVNLLLRRHPPRSLEKFEDEINIFIGDVLKKNSLGSAFSRSDMVINLVGSFFDNTYSLNVLSNLNILKNCIEFEIEKIIFTSSEAVYGECMERPALEDDRPSPVTEYGLTKYLAEEIYRFYSKRFGVNSIILRMSNVYGPGQSSGVVIRFIDAILKGKNVVINGSGMQVRDFLYVYDAVRSIIKALEYDPTVTGNKFEIFNISGPETHTLLELLSIVERKLQKKAKVVFRQYGGEDIKCMRQSSSKAISLLNYKSLTSLEEGVSKVVDDLLTNKKIKRHT